MNKSPKKPYKAQTVAVHGGECPAPNTGATTPNIAMSSTYQVEPEIQFSVADRTDDTGYVYTRWGNPTLQQLSEKLAVLEKAESCRLFSSGMAAISTLFLHFLSSGDHIIMSDIVYAGASELAQEILPKMGIRVSRANTSKVQEIKDCLLPETKMIYVESPCNPICRLSDIKTIATITEKTNILLVVDTTFATPMGIKALELGADIVVHALTKYIGGHGDAVGGALLGPEEILNDLHQSSTVRLGGVMSPFNAWLILRGLSTLPLRMRAHEENAFKLAQFLENHPKILKVIYPGLTSHPQNQLARRQLSNFSGMLTFQVQDMEKAARVFHQHLDLFHYAVSLGHHKSILFRMDTASLLSSSYHLSKAQEEDYRNYAGDGIFRVSVGIEDAEDLCSDMEEALKLL